MTKRRMWLAVGLILALAAPAADLFAEKVRGRNVGRSGSSRSHRVFVPRHHGHGHYTPYLYGHYGIYYGYPAYPYPYYPGGHYVYGRGYDTAWFDTDVSPEDAEVYLDGEFVGIADDFDGFPSYLAVEPGKHAISFRMPGRRSVTRRIRVQRGALVRFTFKLPRGEGEEAVPQEEGDIVIPGPGGLDLSTEPSDEGEWEPEEAPPDDGQPAFLRLRIAPEDATVYIDGEFYGTASRVSGLHGDLRVESGRHEIEVVRPGYRPAKREVRLEEGDRITVEIRLERQAPR